jgi:predicted lipid-binding transport protein (Tim44 family)
MTQHPKQTSSAHSERALAIVGAATELAHALHATRTADTHRAPVAGPLLRAVYLFFKALLPAASREALDALAELTTLQLVDEHLRAAQAGEQTATRTDGHAARIVDVQPADAVEPTLEKP